MNSTFSGRAPSKIYSCHFTMLQKTSRNLYEIVAKFYLILSDFVQIHLTSIPYEINGKPWWFGDFRDNRSKLILLNSLNIRSKIWRRSLKGPHNTFEVLSYSILDLDSDLLGNPIFSPVYHQRQTLSTASPHHENNQYSWHPKIKSIKVI